MNMSGAWATIVNIQMDFIMEHESRSISDRKGMDISIMFFAANESLRADNKYQLFLKAVKLADKLGLKSVWIPERHFHKFGGLYPSPSTLAAAVAATTNNIRIRSGSIVLPLNNPIRVAEEWAVVDNLSGGRVDLGFAQGWNPTDFVLSPANYSNRLDLLFDGVEQINRMWAGKQLELPDGMGNQVEISLFPRPVQERVSQWLTCSTGDENRFIQAGRHRYNVLSALLFQSVEELQKRIDLYRSEFKQAKVSGSGKNKCVEACGHVTLMLHTYLSNTEEDVEATIRVPFTEYLRSSIDLWKHHFGKLATVTRSEVDKVIDVAYSRYSKTDALFCTPHMAEKKLNELKEMGINEIACLIDFGIDDISVLSCIEQLAGLNDTINSNCQYS